MQDGTHTAKAFTRLAFTLAHLFSLRVRTLGLRNDPRGQKEPNQTNIFNRWGNQPKYGFTIFEKSLFSATFMNAFCMKFLDALMQQLELPRDVGTCSRPRACSRPDD